MEEMKAIERPDYVRALMDARMNGFVKVITGIRRCGKSFLLDKLFRRSLELDGVSPDQIISVDLDDSAMKRLRDPLLLDEYLRDRIASSRGAQYVFIDEIQRVRKVLPPGVDLERIAPEDREDAYVTFYDVLNGLRKIPNVDIYVTGSNSRTLSKDIATNFRDRGVQIRLQPLSFAEYYSSVGNMDKLEAFRRYLVWGGMPAAVLARTDEQRASYLKGLFEEVYLKDIVERHAVKDDVVLASLVDVLSSDVGSLTNPHKIGDTLNSRYQVRPSDHTLSAYLEHLTDAFLFTKARRYDVKGRRYIDSPSKYYAMDLGLRNARLNFRDTDRSHPMENVIFNELIRRGYSVDVGVVPIQASVDGKRQMRQHEIDFIVNRGNDKLYIQSALGLPTAQKRDQETLPLRKSGDFFRKIVITEGYDLPLADNDGILHMGVIPFLLDRMILDEILRTT